MLANGSRKYSTFTHQLDMDMQGLRYPIIVIPALCCQIANWVKRINTKYMHRCT